jgi:hypothetical protein
MRIMQPPSRLECHLPEAPATDNDVIKPTTLSSKENEVPVTAASVVCPPLIQQTGKGFSALTYLLLTRYLLVVGCDAGDLTASLSF